MKEQQADYAEFDQAPSSFDEELQQEEDQPKSIGLPSLGQGALSGDYNVLDQQDGGQEREAEVEQQGQECVLHLSLPGPQIL
ncbi:unnamed protein product [Strongylus vulgaris]|uniref:Uncharacterized protein n=1 Tax=Strongylus vulgaris TaxID=40348 RepID=A0A3P7IFI9_STRVU|nr:unnamed protein product [Strongylus vulgaris]